MRKRLLRIIAELVDDETGQVSQAKVTLPTSWEVDYGDLVGSATGAGSATGTGVNKLAQKPRTSPT